MQRAFTTAAISVALVVGGCRAKSSQEVVVLHTDGGRSWVRADNLFAGPIQHRALTDRQAARVAALQRTFAEVDDSSIEKWIDDFKRDGNVDRELSVYEDIANAYTAYITANPSIGKAAKREVYGLLLVRSGATEEEALARTRLHVLDRTQAREVLRRYTHSPRPIRAGN